jgi:hypothetical protein
MGAVAPGGIGVGGEHHGSRPTMHGDGLWRFVARAADQFAEAILCVLELPLVHGVVFRLVCPDYRRSGRPRQRPGLIPRRTRVADDLGVLRLAGSLHLGRDPARADKTANATAVRKPCRGTDRDLCRCRPFYGGWTADTQEHHHRPIQRIMSASASRPIRVLSLDRRTVVILSAVAAPRPCWRPALWRSRAGRVWRLSGRLVRF